ncbi:MAG: cation:proton antiporter [Acidobacteriota bacterium]
MHALGFFVLAVVLFAFGLVSRRAQRLPVTPPMLFVALGFAVGGAGFHLLDLQIEQSVTHTLAELTLVVILFGDATRIDLAGLRRQHDLPMRLLTIGLPLTMLFGTLAGAALLPGLNIWQVALLAAILAPTDAALGQAVVGSAAVPVRIRQTLNVESGLNDGIALPAVLIFFSVACAVEAQESITYWLGFTALQLTVGPLVGALVGGVGGRLIDRAHAAGLMDDTFRRLAAVALALMAYTGAELVYGNGFIAAFIAGLVLGNTAESAEAVEGFVEAEGQLLALFVFLLFGGSLVPLLFADGVITPQVLVYAVLSLTVVRMLPTAIALIGKHLDWRTVVFLGWFGPRGIASILFVLLVLENDQTAVSHDVLLPIVVVTVLLSVFAHGLTAAPGAAWYGQAMGQEDDMPEQRRVPAMPLRLSGEADAPSTR